LFTSHLVEIILGQKAFGESRERKIATVCFIYGPGRGPGLAQAVSSIGRHHTAAALRQTKPGGVAAIAGFHAPPEPSSLCPATRNDGTLKRDVHNLADQN
jgi:hypothetical protein